MRVSKNKTIALFIPTLYGGGAEKAFVSLGIALSNRGYNIDFLVRNNQNPIKKEFSKKIQIVDFNKKRMARTIIPLMVYLISTKPYALISALYLPNAIAIMASKFTGSKTKIITTIHSMDSLKDYSKKSLANHVEKKVVLHFTNQAKCIVAVSKGAAEYSSRLFKIPIKNYYIIYNPLEIEEVTIKSNQIAEDEYFQNDKFPIIISIGRLNPVKDYETLLEAFQIVRSKIPAKMLILGEGTLRGKLEQNIAKYKLGKDVLLPGYINNPYPYLKQADVFVSSSLHESFGLVLIEAMAVGCPIVSTDCPGGVKEVLGDGKYGKLVPVGDPEAMANAILESLSEKPKPVSSEWLNQFSLDIIVNKYIDLIEA